MIDAHKRGKDGEDAAVTYLRKIGYRIDGRNLRFGRYELDIVAYDPIHKMMVFVEVKTRARTSDNYPIRSAMTGEKRQSTRKAVGRWAVLHDYRGPGRIDLLCMLNDHVVEHLKDLGSDFY